MSEQLHEDAAVIWERCLSSLDQAAGSTHRAWLAQTRAVSVVGDTLVLAVPDEFVKDWVEQRYAPNVLGTLARVAGRPLSIRVTVRELEDPLGDDDGASGPSSQAPQQRKWQQHRLNPKYTFDRFVIGSSNRFAHAAAVAVAEAPAKAYNPLFIYGQAGLGKTHLLHAVGHYASNLFPQVRLQYVTSEEFTNEFINAIRDERAGGFQRRYRETDILLIDDIQFLEGKERTQEELFHTFNTLHNADKQIIIPSDRPPKQIATLEDRLRSRFEWGDESCAE